MFKDFWDSQGLAYETIPFDGRSDYDAFTQVGIPAGGIFAGAEEIKQPYQVALYGGTAGQRSTRAITSSATSWPTSTNDGLDEHSDAAVHAILTFAQTNSAVNGTEQGVDVIDEALGLARQPPGPVAAREGGGPLRILRPLCGSDADELCVVLLAVPVLRRRERLVLRGPEGMDEAGDGQERQQPGDDVGHGCDLLALDAEDAEPEGGQQQAAEGLALEEGVALGGDGGQLLLQVRQGGVVGVLGVSDLGPRAPPAARRARRRSGRRRWT